MSDAGANAPAVPAVRHAADGPAVRHAADGPALAAAPAVLVLADDLIWATRLIGQLRTLGAAPIRIGSDAVFDDALAAGAATRAVVDLTARAYDGVAATARATTAGVRVLCVGQHDDQALRQAARAAGAERVIAYRKLFEDGHAALAAWLGVPLPAPGSLAVTPVAGPVEAPRE